MIRLLIAAAACLAGMALHAACAHADTDAAGNGPLVLAFDQRLGQPLPLDDSYTDMSGRAVTLRKYFGQRPAVLVLGYYHCPMLCSTVMDGVLESLRGIGVDYDVIAVSIDPREAPADAARKYEAYSGLMDAGQSGRLHLLTGEQNAILDMTRATGFPYRYDAASGQFGHPAGFLIITPQGRISRYFPGVRFQARDVRLALVEASAGRVGSLADRLVLVCSHYDPRNGQYNLAVMQLARAVGGVTILGLVGMVLVARRRRHR
jgi:protein SCO1/2